MNKKMEKEYHKYKINKSYRKRESVMSSKNIYKKKENGLPNFVKQEVNYSDSIKKTQKLNLLFIKSSMWKEITEYISFYLLQYFFNIIYVFSL